MTFQTVGLALCPRHQFKFQPRDIKFTRSAYSSMNFLKTFTSTEANRVDDKRCGNWVLFWPQPVGV